MVGVLENGLRALRRVAYYGDVPDEWRKSLAYVLTECHDTPDACIVNFDEPAALASYQKDRLRWISAIDPIVIGIGPKNPAHALQEGADVVFDGSETQSHLIAQIKGMDGRMAAARHRHSRLMSLRHRLKKVMAEYQAIDGDLEQAKRLQQGLLQNRETEVAGGRISLMLEERSHIGGDLVGQFPVTDDIVGFFAFDVSGHGITSALLIARLAGMVLGTSAQTNIAIDQVDGVSVPKSPSSVLGELNCIMFDELETEHFFTAILGYFNHATGKVVLAQAGHPNPVLISARGDMKSVGGGGLPIGLVPGADFEDVVVQMKPKDRLLVVSDGIIETPSRDGKSQVTETGLAWLLAKYHRVPALELFDHLLADLRRFQGSTDFEDDLSALLIDYVPADMKSRTADRSPETAKAIAASDNVIQIAE